MQKCKKYKIMSLTNSIEPLDEESTINQKMTLKQRPKPEIITSEALQKSIEILSKYDYKFPSNEQEILFRECNFCKSQFPTIEGKKITCERCGVCFCVNHRKVLDHHCNKIDANKEKILNAKNIFKERMRLLKLKGC